MTDVPTTNSNNPDNTIKPLAEDNSVPFSQPDAPANGASAQVQIGSDQLDPTHQATDSASDIDSHEAYDAGLAAAANASEPNPNNAVAGYDPTKDERKTSIEDQAL